MVTKQEEQKIRAYLAKRFGANKFSIGTDTGEIKVLGEPTEGWYYFGHIDSVFVKQAALGIPARAGQEFTTGDDNAIREMFAAGKDAGAIAVALERTDGGIHARMQRLGLIHDGGILRKQDAFVTST